MVLDLIRWEHTGPTCPCLPSLIKWRSWRHQRVKSTDTWVNSPGEAIMSSARMTFKTDKRVIKTFHVISNWHLSKLLSFMFYNIQYLNLFVNNSCKLNSVVPWKCSIAYWASENCLSMTKLLVFVQKKLLRKAVIIH